MQLIVLHDVSAQFAELADVTISAVHFDASIFDVGRSVGLRETNNGEYVLDFGHKTGAYGQKPEYRTRSSNDSVFVCTDHSESNAQRVKN